MNQSRDSTDVTRVPALHCCARTDLGRARKRNEDCVLADPRLGLLAVADGMGGHRAGDVASRLAIDSLIDHLRSALPNISRSTEAIPAALVGAIEHANERIFRHGLRFPDCAGLGTTIVAGAVFCDLAGAPTIAVAHVGDSRLYRLQRSAGGLTPRLAALTRDHSLRQELLDHGWYPTDASPEPVPQHFLTRALGIESRVAVELSTWSLAADDMLLLCSDGLTQPLDDDTLQSMLLERPLDSAQDLQALADRLIDAANERGGPDNISVVLATLR